MERQKWKTKRQRRANEGELGENMETWQRSVNHEQTTQSGCMNTKEQYSVLWKRFMSKQSRHWWQGHKQRRNSDRSVGGMKSKGSDYYSDRSTRLIGRESEICLVLRQARARQCNPKRDSQLQRQFRCSVDARSISIKATVVYISIYEHRMGYNLPSRGSSIYIYLYIEVYI